MNRRSKRPPVQYLTLEDALRIHLALVDLYRAQGDPIEPPGPRGPHLLPSAVDRPRTSLGGREKYENVHTKAAALFHSLVTSHPFHNGNKRTALVCLLVFLDRNGRAIRATDNELFDFVLSAADGTLKSSTKSGHSDEVVEAIARWIDWYSAARDSTARGMSIRSFLDKSKQAGATWRVTSGGQSWLVRGPNGKSVRISRSTRKIDGPVVRSYLQTLGLSESRTGISLEEFQEGVGPEQELIRRFRNILNRLAHA